ncbi:hypothetical protein DM860_011794 [Cuscuta australis]|uniref:DUF4283 domain-containing protein n=1 Tax=Cuscuta australis TaxID=267555 RepID=A0A328DFL8_9ASTE|nr:hypothetical protein DM860_011794 [Cuscuta australis]
MARKRGRPRKEVNGMQSTPKPADLESGNRSAQSETGKSKVGQVSTSPKTPAAVTFLESIKGLGSHGEVNIEIVKGECSNKNLETRMTKGSYAEVLEGKEKIEYGLTYIKSEEINGQFLAKMSKDDLIEDLGMWDQALVLCILGANPPVEVIEGYVRRIWKDYKIEDVNYLKEGQYVVCFSQIEERDEILKRKYYYFDNKPVYVQAWSPGNQIDITGLKDVPIWVQFPGLNMKYWSSTGLRKVQEEEREQEDIEVQEKVQMDAREPGKDDEGFQMVSKRKSARRLTIDELYKGGLSDAPYTGHYPFLT